MLDSVKEIFKMAVSNPAGLLCTLCCCACAVVYSDNRAFIEHQQHALDQIVLCQQSITAELREMNVRIHQLEVENGQKVDK